jgi:predicted nucleotidyltransferase
MKREEVIQILTRNQDALREFGVKSLSLFGSVARGEASEGSDVDFLVEFDRPTGFFGLIRLQHFLEDLLRRPVDLSTPGSLRLRVRERVMTEAIRVA